MATKSQMEKDKQSVQLYADESLSRIQREKATVRMY